jgi:hypothetical protein
MDIKDKYVYINKLNIFTWTKSMLHVTKW